MLQHITGIIEKENPILKNQIQEWCRELYNREKKRVVLRNTISNIEEGLINRITLLQDNCKKRMETLSIRQEQTKDKLRLISKELGNKLRIDDFKRQSSNSPQLKPRKCTSQRSKICQRKKSTSSRRAKNWQTKSFALKRSQQDGSGSQAKFDKLGQRINQPPQTSAFDIIN